MIYLALLNFFLFCFFIKFGENVKGQNNKRNKVLFRKVA